MRLVLVGVVLCVASLAGTFRGGFVYDDHPYVVENSDLRGGPGRILRLFTVSFPSHAPERGLYRPLTATTYALDRWGGPLEARRYRATNLLLAGLLVVAAYDVLRRVTNRTAAAVAALVFAVHPVHTEAFAWITGRAEILAALGVSLALAQGIAFARRGSPWRAAGAGVAALAAVLAKENGAVAPLLFALWLVLAGGSSRRTRGVRALGAVGAGTVAALVMRSAVLGRFAPAVGERVTDGGFLDRFPLILASTGEHLRLLVWPHPLSVERMPLPPSTLGDPAVLVGGGILIAWSALAVGVRRDRSRLLLVLWTLVALLPVMHLVPIGETVAERFLVLPSIGFAGLVGSLLVRDGRVTGTRAVVLACVVVAGTVATVARARAWTDEEALWADAVRRHPESATAWAALGDAYRRQQWPEEAIPHYERALALAPGLTAARQALAASYDATGHPDRALEQAREAVRLDPDHPVALNNLGARLSRAGRIEQASVLFRRAVELAPGYAPALRNAALAALDRGRPGEARAFLGRARAVDPELPGLELIEARLEGSFPEPHEPR